MILKIDKVDDDIYFDDISDTVVVIEDHAIYGQLCFDLINIVNGVNKTNEIVLLDDNGKNIIKNA